MSKAGGALVAQISDLHIRVPGKLAYGVSDTAATLRQAVEHLNALDPAPDLVLATGDLTDAGLDEEYAHLRALLAPLRPRLFVLPGNHDVRAGLRAAFGGGYLPDGTHLSYTLETGGLRIIALDSTAPGEEGGHIDDERADWLAARLAEDRRPTMIAMHHPPFATGLVGMDALGFRGLDLFATAVAQAEHVERITCGHIHRSIVTRCFGTVATIAPSTAHQLALDLRAAQPSTFVLEPPGFLLHQFTPELGLVSHVATIGDYRGPYPFREPGGSFIR